LSFDRTQSTNNTCKSHTPEDAMCDPQSLTKLIQLTKVDDLAPFDKALSHSIRACSSLSRHGRHLHISCSSADPIKYSPIAQRSGQLRARIGEGTETYSQIWKYYPSVFMFGCFQRSQPDRRSLTDYPDMSHGY